MDIDRRSFLGITCAAAALVGYASVESSTPSAKSFVVPEGQILADLHAHPERGMPEESAIKLLSSGVTALTIKTNFKRPLLSYDDVLNLRTRSFPEVEIQEVDRGLLGKIRHHDSVGYFMRGQEIFADHHVIALGLQKPLRDPVDARRAIDIIHHYRGLAILPHPYLTGNGERPTILEANDPHVKSLAQQADELEMFNAYCVQIGWPLRVYADLGILNPRAKALAEAISRKGVAVSDAHTWSQVRSAGTLFPSANFSTEALFHYLRTGTFQIAVQYISVPSFLNSHIRSIISNRIL